MTEDLAARAREREAALDWSGAEAAWTEAYRERHPDAEEGIERARQARRMTAQLCEAAREALNREELKEAVEPLRAALELSGEEDPLVAPLEREWRDLKHRISKEQRKIRNILGVVGGVLGIAAGVGLTLCFGRLGSGTGSGRALGILLTAGIALGAGAAALSRRFFPVFKQGKVARLTLKRPRRGGRSRRIARWRRDAN